MSSELKTLSILFFMLEFTNMIYFKPYSWYRPPWGMIMYDGLMSTCILVYLCFSMACFSPDADFFVMSLNLAMAALDNLWIIPNSSIFNKNNNESNNTHWQDGMYYNYKNSVRKMYINVRTKWWYQHRARRMGSKG